MRRTVWIAGIGGVGIAIAAAGLLLTGQGDGEEAQQNAVPRTGRGFMLDPTADLDPQTREARAAVLGQAGVAPRRVAGRVTFEGQPVSGATVELRGFSFEPVRVRADADGQFDFGACAARRYVVVAYAPDRAGAHERIDLRDPLAAPAPEALVLELAACEVRVSGTVSDVSGGVITGALVRSQGSAPAITDDQGHYTSCQRRGWSLLVASAEGYSKQQLRTGLYGTAVLDFALAPAASISGTVVSAESNEPIANAEVMVWGRDVSNERAWSDPDGSFRIEGLLPGRYRVQARTDRAATLEPVNVVTRVGLEPDPVRCVLSEMVRVSGRLETIDGAAVAGAVVSAHGESMGIGYQDAVTQKDGSFALLAAPGTLSFYVRDYDLVEGRETEVALPEAEVTLRVASRATVRGKVLRGGEPVRGASVSARPAEVSDDNSYEYRSRQAYATTDRAGAFVLMGLQSGRYRVGAQTDEAFTRGREIEVGKAETVEGVTLELDLAAVIAGTVVDQKGEPVPGVNLTFALVGGADWGHGVTDEAGAFEAGAMSGGGDYSVKMTLGQSSVLELPPAGSDEHPTVYLADGSSRVQGVRYTVRFDRLAIRGRVLRPSGGGVPDVRVQARPKTKGQDETPSYYYYRYGLPQAMTDAEGGFELAGLPAGPYVVSVHGAAGTRVEVDVDAGRDDVVVELPGAAAIDGTVTGFAATPTIRACGKQLGCFDARLEGERFVIDDIPPGTYEISASAGDEVAIESVDVKGGQRATVALTSGGTATVLGAVVEFGTGEAIAGMNCRWRGQHWATGHDPDGAKSDTAGRFDLTVPAEVPVVVLCGGELTTRASDVNVELARATTKQVEITVVRVDDFDPISDWGARLDRDGASIASIDADGPAQAAGLAVGDAVRAVDGVAVEGMTATQVELLIRGRKVGQVAAITAHRGDETIEAAVTIGRPKPYRAPY